MDLKTFRARFQPLFEEFLHRKTGECASWALDPVVAEIIHYPERMAAGEGKRIRPYMAWLMYRACGGEDREEVIRMLVALELFHVFALIHDDIMDRGTTRHGVPTIHIAVSSIMQREKRLGDPVWTGDSQAILIGDLVYQWSQEAFFATSGIDASARERAAVHFRAMIEEVIIGQMIDVDLTTRAVADHELIDRKMQLKTSGYTFVRPLQIGAALAGASPETRDWCVRFGTALGRAFQIQDDLLDLVTPSSESGKTAFSDLQARQHTVFTQFITEHADVAHQKELREVFGALLTEDDRERITRLFEDSGALAHGRAEIDRSLAEAAQALETSSLNESMRDAFERFIHLMKARNA